MKNFLDTPNRGLKPRESGLTVLIDTGVGVKNFEDIVSSFGDYIDSIKFGWCTGLITKEIEKKLKIARDNNIEPYFGGTLFEKALSQNKIKEFKDFLFSFNCKYMEVSNGSLDIDNHEKAKYIKEFSKDFTVFSEVGYKDAKKSQELAPNKWIEYIQEDLDAGAYKVITEARESGKSGICRENGEIRFGLINEILDSKIDKNSLIFEAPNKDLQLYFIKKIGFNVNLGNISFNDIIGLETLRLGLRSDTLLFF